MSARRATIAAALALCAGAPAARAQGWAIALRPEVGVVAPGTFYEGQVGSILFDGYRRRGTVRLESAATWGARLRLGAAGARWRLALGAATADTRSVLRAERDSLGVTTPYGLTAPARLTMASLGVERALRAPAARLGLDARVAATIASTTFETRRFPPFPGPGQPYTPAQLAQIEAQYAKPWNRRYVSPGVDVGLDASWRIRGPLAVALAGGVALVRNETGDMAAAQSEGGRDIDRRETFWMAVPRVSLGIGVGR